MKKLNFELFRRVPMVLQTEKSECGLACISMILGYYGNGDNLFELRNKYGISSRGITLQTLINISRDVGLIARPLSLELEEVSQLRLPCILHWDFNHFVVLTKATERYVVIHNPAFGKKKILLAECSKHFTGVALEVWTEVKFEKEKIVRK